MDKHWVTKQDRDDQVTARSQAESIRYCQSVLEQTVKPCLLQGNYTHCLSCG